jgi:rhamnose utilization protein RhaD (predicted bifunctional aldolase and dehydrogenase)
MNDTVSELIERSNRLGADPRNTNYAGGNTSAKGTDTDPVSGGPVELLWVKGSGGDLGTLTEESGLAVLRLDRLRALAASTRARARGRDGRGVRLLPARQGRGRAVDRHGDARAGGRRARGPSAP